ncbi:MAG: GNAT family N-acetyltransferase [Paracoccaceae bacterium]
MQVPTLHTQRLTLRPQAMADFPAYAVFLASDRARHMGGPFDTRGAWGMFCHDLACWPLFGHGALMVDRTDTGETIGQVGVNAGPLYPEPELGWLLYDGHEGMGIATEAAAALRDWAFANLPLDSFVSYMEAGNAASIALAERLGATRDDTAPLQDAGDLVYRYKRVSA